MKIEEVADEKQWINFARPYSLAGSFTHEHILLSREFLLQGLWRGKILHKHLLHQRALHSSHCIGEKGLTEAAERRSEQELKIVVQALSWCGQGMVYIAVFVQYHWFIDSVPTLSLCLCQAQLLSLQGCTSTVAANRSQDVRYSRLIIEPEYHIS